MTIINIPDKPRKASANRSYKWPTVRKKWLEAHPRCEFCNGETSLEVHHIIPIHVRKDLELDNTNLMTLCEARGNEKFTTHICHYVFGHIYDWMNYNRDIRIDAPIWKEKFLFKP